MANEMSAGSTPTSSDFRVSIIGPNSSMTGSLHFDGELRLEGRIQGDVRCQKLIVGPQGLFQGTIFGDVVRVHGRVEGRIVAKTIFVCDGANVHADIQHQGFCVSASACFEGMVSRISGT